MKQLVVVLCVSIIVIFWGFNVAAQRPTKPQAEYVSSQQFFQWTKNRFDFVLLDVRTQNEYNAGYIESAVCFPYDEIESKKYKILKTKRIVLYSIESSWRAPYAANLLVDLGFKDVYILQGGIQMWKGLGYPLHNSLGEEYSKILKTPDALIPVLHHNKSVQPKMFLKLNLEELAQFDGLDGRKAYVAVYNVIYDVTESRLWRGGKHAPAIGKNISAGKDLTLVISVSPHGIKNLKKYPQVGILVEKKKFRFKIPMFKGKK